MADASQKLAALMFTDIVGYSRLMGENEYSTVDLVQIYRDNLTRSIEENNGQVRDFIGDGLFASFGCGLDAVRAGIQIQLFLHEFNRSEARRSQPALIARVGIHLGDVLEMDGKLYGDDVNIAARLEPLAEPGALCVSQAVFDQLNGDEKVEIVKLGPQKLKNIKKVFECYQLLPQAVTFQQRLRMAKRYFLSQLRVRPKRTAAAALVIFTFIGYLGVREWQARQIPEGYYLEVADFTNAGNKAGGTNYFSEGITDAVRAQLAGIDKLYLVRSDERVGAPLKLEGSVLREEGRIRVIYRITRRKDGILIGGKTHDGVDENIFGLQDKLASSIAADLTAHYEFTDVQLAQAKFTSDITAYDYYMRGRAYLRSGASDSNLNAAIDAFDDALKFDPRFARAVSGLCESYTSYYLHSKTPKWVGLAKEACSQALVLNADLPDAHLAQGVLMAATGDWDSAISELTKAIDLDAKSSEAYAQLADVYYRKNDVARAEQIFKRAIDLEPGNWRGYNLLARFYAKTGEFDKALAMYDHVALRVPEFATVYSNQGAVYFYMGDFSSAEKVFRKSLAIEKTSEAYSNIGTMLYYLGRFEQAAEMFKSAVKLSPDDHRLVGNLADAYRHTVKYRNLGQESYRHAIKLATHALSINQKDVETLRYIGMYYGRIGMFDKANFYINKASVLRPNDVEISLAQAYLYAAQRQQSEAITALHKVVRAGYSSDLLKSDPDIKDVWGLVVQQSINTGESRTLN